MKLSIIIPALNEAAGIEAVLQRLQAWRRNADGAASAGPQVEIIVADGGSADATRALAAPLADQVIEAPRGRARQMNAGAAAAGGDALLFLHADTILPEAAPTAILVALFAAKPLAPTVFSDIAGQNLETAGDRRAASVVSWGRFDVTISGAPSMLRVVAWSMNLRSRATGIATGDQAIFMTRTAFDAAGGFPDQPLMEDIEISRRLKRLSRPACLSAKVVTSGRRWEMRGVWRTIFLMWRLRLAYFFGAPAEYLAARYR